MHGIAALRLPLALAAILALWAGPALAHKVNVFALVDGGRIVGEAYFGGGGKAMDSPVELRDASGRKLAETRTGPDGAFSLPLPEGAAPPLTVTLKAGDGHGADFTLEARDLGQTAPAPGASSPRGQNPEHFIATSAGASPAAPAGNPPVGAGESNPGAPKGAPATASASSAPAAPQALDPTALKALVEEATAKAVDAKLAPLRLELAKLSDQRDSGRLRDIVGGIGWIVGLVGIAAWFKRPK